jgi:hypothetical protein
LEAAWFLLLATYFIWQRRCLLAGGLWGLAYLCHPLALLSTPALLAIVFLEGAKEGRPRVAFSRRMGQCLSLFLGLAFCVGMWAFINRHHFVQTHFLTYVALADGRVPTLANWLHSLHLFLLHSDNASINSMYQPSPSVVHFFFQYWTTLPFAVGIVFFPFLVRTLWKALFLERAWLAFVFVIPFAAFSVYWGSGTSGLLREGLHPWVLGLLLFCVVMWKRSPSESVMTRHTQFTWLVAALLIRGFETMLMLLLTTIWTNHEFVSSEFALGDILSLLAVMVSVFLLHWLMLRHGWQMRSNSVKECEPDFGQPL